MVKAIFEEGRRKGVEAFGLSSFFDIIEIQEEYHV